MKKSRSLIFSMNARNKAQRYLLRKKPEKAFEYFIIAFKTNPYLRDDKDEIELFLVALHELSKALDNQERFNDLLQYYKEALEIFPDHEDILSNLGAYLLRFSYVQEACHYFRKALNVNHYFLPAKRNLESAANLAVERWHFSMLNDKKRNEAFQSAITKRVNQGFNTILDIGTGSGILSLFAVNAGAVKVYACDSSSYMMEIAALVMASNNVTSEVKLIHKKSTHLTIPTDLPKKVSLVVAELFDAGIFGEGILQTLHHAWNHLLIEPDPYLKYDNELPEGETSCRAAVIPQGFNLWIAAIECSYINSKYSHIRSEDAFFFMDIPKDLTSETDGYYDSEPLRRVPGGYRLLSRPKCALSLNLNNPRKVAGYLHGDMKIPEVKAHFIRTGRLDAIAVWFELTLDGKTVMISTSPEEETCWDQAVFPVHISTEVKPGEDISLEIFCKNGELRVEPDYATYMNYSSECVSAPQVAVRFLNDTIYLGALKEVANNYSRRVLTRILDFSPIPVLGIKLFKTSVVRELVSVVTSEMHKTAVKDITDSNFITKDNIQIILDQELNEDEQFDLVITNLIDSTGELQDKAMTQLPLLKQMLRPNVGILLPRALIVQCVLVESNWLAEVSEVVSDDRTCGFQIGEHFEVYQISQHLDFNLETIGYAARSEFVAALDLSTMDCAEPMEHKVKTKITSSGFVNAIPYWFNICWLEGSEPVSTMHPGSHINQSAFLVRPPVAVTEGEIVSIVARYCKGVLELTLSREHTSQLDIL